MTVLIDSDVLIEVSRGRDRETITQWTDLSGAGAVVLYSPVSVAELWAGVRPSEHGTLNDLFHSLSCASVDEETGRRAGNYLRQYRRSHGLEIADALVAAGAVTNRA